VALKSRFLFALCSFCPNTCRSCNNSTFCFNYRNRLKHFLMINRTKFILFLKNIKKAICRVTQLVSDFFIIFTELTIKMLPMLCYAFFFENILIPVSKAFVLKDHNGSMGMKSSIISLSCSLIFYTFILAALSYIKYQNGDYLNS
jgi:hypothetical protein